MSNNIENFSKLLPKYFTSLIIEKKIKNEIFVEEKIPFLFNSIKVKTKHIIENPNKHEIHILSGPLKKSSFIEYYEPSNLGTEVKIYIKLHFNGVFKILYPLTNFIENKINNIMDEFIFACENKKNLIRN